MTAITASIQHSPQLRPLNILRDLPAVADLVEKCFADTMDAEGRRYIQQIRRSAKDNSFLNWAASAVETASMPLSGYVWVEDDVIVGNASIIPFRYKKRRVYLIANVAVSQDHRRKGIGRNLMLAAMNQIRQKRGDATWLHVRADNPSAILLYQRLGFVEQTRRTTWHARPDRSASVEGLGVNFSNHPAQDWLVQETWIDRLYPENYAWYQPVPKTLLRPGFAPALYRFFLETEVKNWTIRFNGELKGVLTWQPLHGVNDRLWAAIPPEGSAIMLTALLLRARRDLAGRTGLSLDLPADEHPQAVEAAGFTPQRTLIWMRLDETAAASMRRLD